MPVIARKPRIAATTHLVAVYGTLKRGKHNNYLLDGAQFVGAVKTVDKYPLVIDGLPYLLEVKGEGHQVQCELYRVNDELLARLDRLEGHPHFYCRRQIWVCSGDDKRLTWIYFLAPTGRFASIKDLPYHEKY